MIFTMLYIQQIKNLPGGGKLYFFSRWPHYIFISIFLWNMPLLHTLGRIRGVVCIVWAGLGLWQGCKATCWLYSFANFWTPPSYKKAQLTADDTCSPRMTAPTQVPGDEWEWKAFWRTLALATLGYNYEALWKLNNKLERWLSSSELTLSRRSRVQVPEAMPGGSHYLLPLALRDPTPTLASQAFL